ncbi:MAG TPA: ACP S-malonyltransferase [Candidatus Binataceae bacterium]|nr:ACP S-malonyltransferase [Candidatus Binataceae bacterium]
MKLAFLFPGQGSQKVGMGADLVRDFEPARRVFEEADEALGFNLSRLCFEGPDDELRLTINTQPAILTAAIAALRVFERDCGVTPELAAGHSLGEYGALVAAGTLRFRDAVKAVRERGRLMQEACAAGHGAMAALIGLDAAAVKAICDEVSAAREVAVPANFNTPDQIVISGHAAPVRKALELAKARGARASVELNVSAPFHSPLMLPALEGMAPILGRITFHKLNFGVISNLTAQVNHDPNQVLKLLLEQIVSPVRWEESMRTMVGAGVIRAVEFGPGRVLAGLMRRIDRSVTVYPAEDTPSLRATMAAIAPGT